MKHLPHYTRILALRLVLLAFGLIPLCALSQTSTNTPPLPPMPAIPGVRLTSWRFDDTNFLSDISLPPLFATNIDSIPSWDGYALQVDNANPAGINYRVIENNGHTNLTLDAGTVLFCFKPNWSSTNLDGGTGPTEYGRLIDVGLYTTNAGYGWWSLYFDPSGTTLNFSSQTNGAEATYLSVPIAWSADTWHFIALTYSSSNSALYLDGQLATNGPGVLYRPGPEVLTNGFYLGSDYTGWAQSHGAFDNLNTWNYPISSNFINIYYNVYATNFTSFLSGLSLNPSIEAYAESGPPSPPGGTNNPPSQNDFTNTFSGVTYGTNDFWLEMLPYGTNSITQDTNSVALILHGTVSDIAYQILSKQSLTDAVWTVEQNLLGSVNQNWTPTTVSMSGRPTLFFKALAYTLDTDGDGLPDWWEIKYGLDPNNPDTGNTGTPDGYKDPDTDGWTNIQEYQNGLDPNNPDTPPPPQAVSAHLDATGTNVVITWASGGGSVVNYQIKDFWNDIQLGQVNGNTFSFNYAAGSNSLSTYSITANYANGASVQSPLFSASRSDLNRPGWVVRGQFAQPYLVLASPPASLAYVKLTYYDTSDERQTRNIAATNFVNGAALLDPDISENNIGTYQLVATDGGFGDEQSVSLDLASEATFDDTAYNITDGPKYLKENLKFLLRAATCTSPFSYGTYQYAPRPTGPTNYEFYGFHQAAQQGDHSVMSTHRPVEDNYLWRNFVYNADDFTPAGEWTIGAYSVSDPSYRLFLSEPAYYMDIDDTGTNPPPAALAFDSNNSQWLFALRTDSSDDVADIGLNRDSVGPAFQYFLPTGVRNTFGLRVKSILLHAVDNTNQTICFAGGSPQDIANFGVGDFFIDAEAPQLTATNYYFASQTPYFKFGAPLPPLPGSPAFSVTNTSPLIIAPFGQPIHMSSWAKMAITNGYLDRFAYLEQYFDKAYKIDANGNATTNETGILSPYGDFFPTEPGKVALVTMADIDTNQRGTGVVNVIKLQLDVNHDGVMDLSFAGPDNTSADRPFKFWINNDYDALQNSASQPDGQDDNFPARPDFRAPFITSNRDLEDYTRLWICGLPELPATDDYKVTLSWNVLAGSPAINLVRSADTTGSMLYLTDMGIAIAQRQFDSPIYERGPAIKFLTISPTNSLILPGTIFTNEHTKYFLFEGAGVGKGELVLTVTRSNQVIASTSTFIEIKEVKDMFEHVHIENAPSSPPSSTLTDQSTFKVDNYVPVDPNDGEKIIVFVH